jgi:spore maturation protein CgeB/GT2 family glycosyltransferase/tetratricopeptide (TPR) repeat protein
MQTSPASGSDRFARFQKMLANGEAIIRNALTGYRRNGAMTGKRAPTAMARQDWLEVVNRWQAVLDRKGENAPAGAYLWLCRGHRALGDLAAAESVIGRGLARHQGDLEMAIEHAEVAMARRDWGEAVKRWQSALENHCERAPANLYVRLGRALRLAADLEAATAVIREGLARHRNHTGLAAEHAEIAMAQRLWPEAIKRWQEIVETGGDKAPASVYLRLARAHCLHRDPATAEATVQDGLARYPGDGKLLAEHAEIAMAQEDWFEAVARWQTVIKTLGPKAPANASLKLARVHRFQEDLTAAETVAKEGLSRFRNNAELLAELAEIAMVQLDWSEAIARWQIILDTHGQNAPANVRRRLEESEKRQAERAALGLSGHRVAPGARRFNTSFRWGSRLDAAGSATMGLDGSRPCAPASGGVGAGRSSATGAELPVDADAEGERLLRHDGWDAVLAPPLGAAAFGSFYVHANWIIADFPKFPTATRVPELRAQIDGSTAGTLTLGKLPDQLESKFTFPIPAEYCDDAEHSISVFVHAEGGFYLRSRQGRMTWPFRRRHKGTIESFEGGILHGWVIDQLDQDAECEIRLLDGPNELGAFHTRVSRADVNRTFGVSGRHGFAVPVPPDLFDGKKHDLRVLAGDEEIVPTEAPRLVTVLAAQDRSEADTRYIGNVDHADCYQVRGWARDRSSTSPVHVRVEVDGVAMAIARAAVFRNKPLSDESRGHHGFRVALSRALMNGRQRQVQVFIVEGNVKLGGTTNRGVNFPLQALAAPRICEEPFFGLEDGIVCSTALAEPRADRRTVSRDDAVNQGSGAVVVSMIVLNWNGAELLRHFLASLAALAPIGIEVIVIDHGSEDDSREIIESYRSRLTLTPIYRPGNFSFAESNNLGARLAVGEYLLFVNNDIIFVDDCIDKMRAQLAHDADVGVVGIRLKEPDYHGEAQWGLRDHHRGIEFIAESLGRGRNVYLPAEIFDAGVQPPHPDLVGVQERVAVTAALCMVRKQDFLAVGGFHTGYFYGLEDVDLCLSIRGMLGKRTVCVGDSWAIHNRSATRERKIASAQTAVNPYQDHARTANRDLLLRRFGPTVFFHTLRETLAGSTIWREAAPRATFVVTAADIHTAAGDYFTAMELGEACRAEFGWEIAFAVMTQHGLAKSDLVVSLRDDYAVTEITDLSPGAVLIAWIRNRVDQWIASGNLDKYHLIFCSSQKAIDAVREATGRRAFLLPVASNTDRFRPMPPSPKHAADVVFTGHFWGDGRDAINPLDPSTVDFSLAIYGPGWDKHEGWRDYWRGLVPYYELPEVYSSAKIVIDHSHPVTRDWNSLNARVFDALASGTLLLTNCEGGAREIFGNALPTFSCPEELRALITNYLDAPEARKQLAASLHERVVAEHSYRARAKTVKATVCDQLSRSLRIAIKIGIPRRAEKESWGDFHFAHSLRRAFERNGCYARVDILPDWYGGFTAGDDVVIVLRGVSRYEIVPGPLTCVWLISHPDAVPLAELQQYHHVFVASESYAETLSRRLGDNVSSLLQCADPEIFRPSLDGELRDQVVFIGNTRGQRRTMVTWAMEAGLDFRVFGRGWAASVPAGCYGGDYIPNEQLAAYYGNGNIVLNDHWPDMAAEGFLSNRLFDAAAVGAKIISDPAEGLTSVFGDLVTVCRSAADLKAAVELLQRDDRFEQAQALRDAVLEKHTFDHRAARILDVARRMIGVSPGDIRPAYGHCEDVAVV